MRRQRFLAPSETAAAAIQKLGFVITPDALTTLAQQVGESSIISRTGGALTLPLGWRISYRLSSVVPR